MTKSKLSPAALGLALAVVWGSAVLIVGLLAHYFSYGKAFVTSMGIMYIGYEPSIVGSIIGGVMGFIDAFIGGALIAWLYNLFLRCCCKNNTHCE
jgi:hypothetical protein